jgi:hypothetical protein
LPVLTYHKYCTVLDVFEKPPLYLRPYLYVFFSSVRLVLSWGSIVGIWYYVGLTSAIISVALYFLIGTLSLRILYNKQVKKWYNAFIITIEKEPPIGVEDRSPEKKQAEALRLAKQAVDKAMKGES